MIKLQILHAPPLLTIQDQGRPLALPHGVSASGPMDRAGYIAAGNMLENTAATCLEISAGKTSFVIEGGSVAAAFSGGSFSLKIAGRKQAWDHAYILNDGDRVKITPTNSGNYGYVRFDLELDVPKRMGSRATNLIAGIGGFDGRSLVKGDEVPFVARLGPVSTLTDHAVQPYEPNPIRIIWGLHAELFSHEVRTKFLESGFSIANQIDRMGMRLQDGEGVFDNQKHLSLVSDAVVPGDIQILGDGSPIVLMRDHQPTGGYPRIATVIDVDMDRLAQSRPGTEIKFLSISVSHAHELRKKGIGH